MKSKTLVMIPAYNEALNIKKTVEDVLKNAPGVDYIVINDGSKDNTKEVLELNHFHYLDSICNQGLFGAIQLGFRYAKEKNYDIAIQFDGDGQHCAKYINDLVSKIEKGDNITIGSRFVSEPKPITPRMLGSRLISFAIRLSTKKTIMDPTSGFRAYDKQCINEYADSFNNPPEPDTLAYMILKGRKVSEIQVQMKEREFGESYLNLSSSIQYMSRMLISILFIQHLREK